MPLTDKDRKVQRAFGKTYGSRGKSVYYASLNAGKIKNTPESRRFAKKRAHKR